MLRLIIHKIREGSIDGLTLVYSHIIGKWLPVSEIVELKEMINKLDEEEASAASAVNDISDEKMVFIPDEDEHAKNKAEFAAYCERKLQSENKNPDEPAAKKSFIADDGKKYGWDDEEESWVEINQSDSEDDDDQQNEDDVLKYSQTSSGNPSKINQEVDSEVQASKTKRKRKNKSKSSKGWIYITGPKFINLNFT